MSDLLGVVWDPWTTTKANEWEEHRWGLNLDGGWSSSWWWRDFPRPYDREDIFQLGEAAEATIT